MALEPRKPLPFLIGSKQANAGQRIKLVFAVFVASLVGANVSAQLPSPPEHVKESFPSQKHYSPYADRNFPTEVLWGDTHLHTGNSLDAGAFGATLLPEDAHRFARGEELTSSTGLKVKLSRPLDFLVVADHSDNMGFFPLLQSGDPSMLADPLGKKWYDMIKEGGQQGVAAAVEIILSLTGNTFPDALYLAPGSAAYRNTWVVEYEGGYYIFPGSITGAYSSHSPTADNPSFILLAVQGSKMVCYVYELEDGEVDVSKIEFEK